MNVIAVKEGNENSEKTKALVDVLKSDAIKQYINDTYDGAVIPFNYSDIICIIYTKTADTDLILMYSQNASFRRLREYIL